MVNHPPCPVRYGQFAQYVTTHGPGRVSLARELARQFSTRYDPRTDHYGALRRAVLGGTLKGHLAERLALAVRNAAGSRASTYPRLAANYQRWYEQMGLAEATIHKIPARTWPDTGLIRVNPMFAVRYPAGPGMLVTVHWRAAPISDEAVVAMLRLAQIAYSDQPDLVPVVLDVQRSEYQVPVRQDADYDEWLRSEAASLAVLLTRLADTA